MRSLSARALILSLVGCATPTPVAPPPAVDPARLEQARKIDPMIVDEVELLDWAARESARRGDEVGAERRAWLARRLLSAILAPRPTCEEAEKPQPPEPTAQEPSPPKKRSRRFRRSKVPSPKPEDSLDSLFQASAEHLQSLEDAPLSPADRVRVDTARRALVEAQEAVAAGAMERAKLHLERVRKSVSGINGAPQVPEVPGKAPSTYEALARDLERHEPTARREAKAILLPLAETPGAGEVTPDARGRLQTVGRLLRVYGTVRVCVGGTEPDAEAVTRFLIEVEKVEPERISPCESLSSTALYVALLTRDGDA